MEEIRSLCEECLNGSLYRIIISKSRNTGTEKIQPEKIRIRPVILQEELVFQASETHNNQIFHRNMNKEETIRYILSYLGDIFLQAEFSTVELQATVLISKKGKITVSRKRQKGTQEIRLSHNKEKNYLLKEGQVVPFLVDLGVQTPEGKIVKSKYDKFRQINRYLEFIADIMDFFPGEEPIHIVDFGCGKSYLTFALYYYMEEICKRNIRVTGLDLKEKVIEDCSRLAKKYGYRNLKFEVGDVSGYETQEPVDMVVTLHACDTATDFALERAISWNAKVIFSVPCCQHELNRQITSQILEPVLKYGLIKERMAALVTDAIRANLLEEQGYQVQVMEFIDMEHTPKNILIRAVKDGRLTKKKKKTGIEETAAFLGVENTLQKLLEKQAVR